MKTRTDSRPTIKDIAGACGVSEATVSYVMNGKRILKPATREKVFRAMREMNYHPSAVARGLSSKRVHTLGILFGAVDSIEFATNSYVSGLLQGIMLHAQREGFDITFFTASWKDAENSAPKLRDGRTDGVLAISPLLNSDMLQGLSSLGIPHVVISGDPSADIVNVDVDNFAGACLATEHIIGLGHRAIAHLMGNDDMASFAPRRAGFRETLEKASIEVNEKWVRISGFDGAFAREHALELLRGKKRPTAIVAGNDHIALGVLEAARALGIAVPQQLSVVGFDDIPAAGFSTPQLTTVRQPLREIGEVATHMLIDHVREPKDDDKGTRLILPDLVVRGTTAAVPEN